MQGEGARRAAIIRQWTEQRVNPNQDVGGPADDVQAAERLD